MNTQATKLATIKRQWHLVDAKDVVLGRVSSQVAQLLIGKHKPYFVPNLDCGDYVVVINSDAIKVTGNKMEDKKYYRHSGYPGGLKTASLREKMSNSTRVIEHAVKGMLPKNKLQDPRLRRLKVFKDANHPYQDKLTPKATDNNN